MPGVLNPSLTLYGYVQCALCIVEGLYRRNYTPCGFRRLASVYVERICQDPVSLTHLLLRDQCTEDEESDEGSEGH